MKRKSLFMLGLCMALSLALVGTAAAGRKGITIANGPFSYSPAVMG